MAVTGPNSEGFASIDAALLPTFSPVAGPSDVPLLPSNRANGRVAAGRAIGGMGFSFFDRGRPKELAFNYIVTTGNEACLEGLDIVEHLIDDGRTDAFLMLIEDIKTPETFRRVAEKALRAGKPLIVNKIGKTDAGARAAASHTAALAGSYSTFQAMAQRYGVDRGRHGRGDGRHRQRLPGLEGPAARPAGASASARARAAAAPGCPTPARRRASRCRRSMRRPAPSSIRCCRAYGTSQNPVDGTAQAIRQIGYAGLLGPIANSPVIDGVIAVMSARSAEHLDARAEKLQALKAATKKPILMWSYTLPAPAAVRGAGGGRLPALHRTCSNVVATMRQMGDWQRAARARS